MIDDLQIHRVEDDNFGRRWVLLTADGRRYRACVGDSADDVMLYAFGAKGDSCVTTHRIENPMLATAVLRALSR